MVAHVHRSLSAVRRRRFVYAPTVLVEPFVRRPLINAKDNRALMAAPVNRAMDGSDVLALKVSPDQIAVSMWTNVHRNHVLVAVHASTVLANMSVYARRTDVAHDAKLVSDQNYAK